VKIRFVISITLAIVSTCYAEDISTIAEVHCNAQWKGSLDEAKKAYVGLKLHPGESVGCISSGYLLAIVYGRSIAVHAKDGWYLIPRVRPSQLTAEEDRRETALRDYARRGGRERSGGMVPAAISPRHFDVFYTFHERGPIAVSLRRMDKEIWNGIVRHPSGLITSDGARRAIFEYQRTGGGPLTLLLRKGDKQNEIFYSVLSREAEREIENQLTVWEGEKSPFMRHVGRASVFDESGLYEAAACEYHNALQEALGSQDLIIAAVREFEQAGDYVRAHTLKMQLAHDPRDQR
jgi:hypothetical protein